MLFNTQGYKATSIGDIVTATGLSKGAVYRHFESKQALESAAFLYLENIILSRFKVAVKQADTAGEKIRQVFLFFESYLSKIPVAGGCPILNAAVEADDSAPHLRKNIVAALANIKKAIVHILENGKKFGQIKMAANSQETADIIIASLEGAVMMSKLKKSNKDLKTVIGYLNKIIEDIEKTKAV